MITNNIVTVRHYAGASHSVVYKDAILLEVASAGFVRFIYDGKEHYVFGNFVVTKD